MKQKLHHLYRDVFSRLRDDQGRPVSPNQYALPVHPRWKCCDCTQGINDPRPEKGKPKEIEKMREKTEDGLHQYT